MSAEPTNGDAVLLCTANNDMDAAVLESLLKSFDIPVLKKRTDSGGVAAIYIGASFTQVELLVPASLLEKAQAVLSAEHLLEEGQENDGGFAEMVDRHSISRRRKACVLLMLFVGLPVIGAVVGWAISGFFL